jgi:repressor LexA
MIGDGILNGDLVLLRPQVEVPHGAIAAACVGDEREATLKRVFFEQDQVRLRASNPAYPDVVVPAAVISFAGLFKGLIRHATHSP